MNNKLLGGTTFAAAIVMILLSVSGLAGASSSTAPPEVAARPMFVTVGVQESNADPVALSLALAGRDGCAELRDERPSLVHELKICRDDAGLLSLDLGREKHSKEHLDRRRIRVHVLPEKGRALPIAGVDVEGGGTLRVTLSVE